jgi:hypothetical protein
LCWQQNSIDALDGTLGAVTAALQQGCGWLAVRQMTAAPESAVACQLHNFSHNIQGKTLRQARFEDIPYYIEQSNSQEESPALNA